jgi:hypothetical protein
MLDRLQRLSQHPILSRIRRNHGLEHATIHLLSRRYPSRTLIGRADARGFFIYGEVSTSSVQEAVAGALERLRAGEHRLAIHPNCGTNFLAAALLAGAASFLALLGGRQDRWRDRLERLPVAIFLTSLALILAQPLGTAAQRHLTTQGDPGALEIAAVRRMTRGRTTIHRVLTRG